MYRRLSAIMFPLLAIVLVGAVLWGYQVNQEKNSILIKAENQYQRAFHDLSFHVEKLNNEIGNTLALNTASHASQRKGLVNVWRLTSQAQNEINQLPLTLMPFSKTEEFLSNVANFSYRAAVRDLTNEPLNEDEMKTLAALYDHSRQISTDLRDVQSKVIANNLRWMDVEVALATEEKALDNTIIDGFQTVDKKVSSYEEMNWGPSMAALFEKRSFQTLGAADVTAEQVKEKAKQFLGDKASGDLQVVENGNGMEYSAFSVTGKRSSGEDISLDYTKQGGQLIWYMAPRDVGEAQIGPAKSGELAKAFLDSHGYANMTPISYDMLDNIASIVFAGVQDDVIIYPEKVTVKMALDNGEVLGVQANDYLFEHKQRNLPMPKLSPEQAKTALNPSFNVQTEKMALIKNDIDKEVLCYQYTGTINGALYRIFINTDNRVEEKMEMLQREDATVNNNVNNV